MRLQILTSLAVLLLRFTSAYTWTTKDQCPDTINTIISSDYCTGPDKYRCREWPQFPTMDSVHEALMHCPNLTALDLRVTGLGCSEWPDTWSFPLSPLGGERYANLTSLRVEGYDFSTVSLSKRSDPYAHENSVVQWALKALSAAGMEELSQKVLKYNPVKSNLQLWLNAMDWSGVEELMISKITDEMLEKLPPRLKSLKRLETSNMSFIDCFPNNTLTHLTWIGNSDPHDLPYILERQGASLRNLQFRIPERESGPFLPDFNISILPTMAPHLSHIALNIPRNGTWPLDTLDIIASLPELSTADIYMNIQSECAQQRPNTEMMSFATRRAWEGQCDGEDQYQKPIISKAGAEKMFGHMRGVKSGVELRNVTFYVGDWTRPWDGPLYFPDWFDGKREQVTCSLDNKIDEGWCVVEKPWWDWDDDMDD